MPDPRRETDWLANIPLWFKAVVGLMGTIATIAGFIVAWRENGSLYLLVTLALLLGGVFLLSLYLLIARRQTRSKKTPGTYRFQKLRAVGLLGMIAVCAVLAMPLVLPSAGDAVRDTLRGTSSPTPSVTPTPTGTPVPSATPIPSFTPVPTVQVDHPDVWIAPFRFDASVQNQWAEAEIEQALQAELLQFEGQRVTVRADGPPVQELREAQAILSNERTKVVIWGEYNAQGAQVRMLLSDGAGAGRPLAPTGVIDIESGSGDHIYSLEFTLKKRVPQNISFLSLFVIGHLAYLSNDYQTGHDAFDAAMRQIPEHVVIQNGAVLSFFKARDLHKTEPPDLPGAICKYVEAIQADRESGVVSITDVAYNNLGLLVSRLYGDTTSVPAVPETPLPPAAASCLQQLGMLEAEYQDPKVFFQRALDSNPSLTLARYNKLVFEWRQNPTRIEKETRAQFQADMEAIEREDESIIGTYIVRAMLHDESDEEAEAIRMYLRGIEQDPRIPLLHMNVGQLYLAHENDLPEAEKHLRAALYREEGHQEARLALANLYYRTDRLPEAMERLGLLLARIDLDSSSPNLVYPALVLRSSVAFKQGDLPAARDDLNRAIQLDPYDPQAHLLLGLLYQGEGRMEEATSSFETASGQNSSTPQGAWTGLKDRCFPGRVPPVPFADWMLRQLPSDPCLGTDLTDHAGRVRRLYDLFSDTLLLRRDPALLNLLGAQCPFLYTRDPITGEWEFETTILYQIVGREAVQRRPLARFDGQILIREVEPEISYLNQIYILAEMADGSFQRLEPDIEELQRRDEASLVLHQGDEIVVTLDGRPLRGEVRRWWVVAVGYYVPLP